MDFEVIMDHRIISQTKNQSSFFYLGQVVSCRLMFFLSRHPPPQKKEKEMYNVAIGENQERERMKGTGKKGI